MENSILGSDCIAYYFLVQTLPVPQVSTHTPNTLALLVGQAATQSSSDPGQDPPDPPDPLEAFPPDFPRE